MNRQYLAQLEKAYPAYLRSLIEKQDFTPVILRGGKSKPATTAELHQQVQVFQQYEKSAHRPGWHIHWNHWNSKRLGRQQWPDAIIVETAADLEFLLQKREEVELFKTLLQDLLQWKPALQSWLSERPAKIVELQHSWTGLRAVVDYLLDHEVQAHYKRSLPVPVHTKFIEQHETILLSVLRHLSPKRFVPTSTTLEQALSLRTKPHLFPIRWLDQTLAQQYAHGMEVLAVTAGSLQNADWLVKEIWLVENETNLYLLPWRSSSLAIFARGYALELLAGIPLLQNNRLIYWGDLDEDGFCMLHRMRQLYPHTISAFMDLQTVNSHIQEITTQPKKYSSRYLDLLTDEEKAAFEKLFHLNGRIEQEKLDLLYVQEEIRKLTPWNNH